MSSRVPYRSLALTPAGHAGFDAGAVDIVNVVLGFLVVVAGVILLQLSKANVAEEVVGGSLDRRSSMLLTASRSRIYQDGDREKTLEAEDPGMDALRGGFGAIGSIHRALSYKRSMRREARFDPSEVARRKNGAPGAAGSGPSEMAMNTLRGVQLYDNPMPIDSADKISLHSSRFASGDDSQRPRSASIQFAPSDAVHMCTCDEPEPTSRADPRASLQIPPICGAQHSTAT